MWEVIHPKERGEPWQFLHWDCRPSVVHAELELGIVSVDPEVPEGGSRYVSGLDIAWHPNPVFQIYAVHVVANFIHLICTKRHILLGAWPVKSLPSDLSLNETWINSLAWSPDGSKLFLVCECAGRVAGTIITDFESAMSANSCIFKS